MAARLRDVGALFDAMPVPAAPRMQERWLLVAVLLLAALLRFWELGSFSFHKPDEDTTVLAASHILEDGTPRFPSGMFYGRAVVQSYLIGASFALFGESEWSARLPSALCGILAVWLGWLVSRRFLAYPWRIGFALALALLPIMISDSQEARMYGFMVAALLGATWQVFRWEERFATRHLVYAVLWMLLAIQFQVLAVLGSAVLLFPGLARGDLRRTLQGMAALLAVGVGYLLLSEWQVWFYPETATEEYFPGWSDPLVVGPQVQSGGIPWLAIGAVVALGGLLAAVALRQARHVPMRWLVVALVVVALLLQATLQYHLALVSWLAALVIAWRQGPVHRGLLVALLAGAAALAAVQLGQLVASGTPPRQAVGQMTGWPSVWPLLQAARFSWVAAAIVAIGAVVALYRLARRRSISPIWMYFALTVWVPLVFVGVNAWFVPPRYIEFAMAPMLLTAFVVAADQLAGRRWVAALPVALLVANPVASWEAVVVGDRAADHRGAARFLQALPLREDDIIIAEEALMQKYYLGRVDYWLVSRQVGAQFVVVRDGQYVDQYTHSRLVDSVEALQRVIDGANGRRVFIIGSAQGGDRSYNRGAELDALLEGGHLPVIHEGANGSRIWAVGMH